MSSCFSYKKNRKTVPIIHIIDYNNNNNCNSAEFNSTVDDVYVATSTAYKCIIKHVQCSFLLQLRLAEAEAEAEAQRQRHEALIRET